MKSKQTVQRERVADYKTVFETDAGARVLNDLMQYAHILHPSYVKGDSAHTAFREGERNVILRILAILGKEPKDIKTLSVASYQSLTLEEGESS